jgi:hypothetical protein
MIEALLLSVTRVTTLLGGAELTNATGFFFDRDDRLFLITARHVVLDEASSHAPDALRIELHVDPKNVVPTRQLQIPLYRDGVPVWRQSVDDGGLIDVVAVELGHAAAPESRALHAFTPAHLVERLEEIEVGTPVLIVGFPLGFHDTLHRLPVARQAVIASSFGIRFQGHGYFLTDARMHRGSSGAPVVVRAATSASGRSQLTWRLLGIHASRLDMTTRDLSEDERLNLNCAWYADVLMVLTAELAAQTATAPAVGSAPAAAVDQPPPKAPC